MEVPELNFKECASVFVRDDFYESIQAPKFHDFCSSFEEEPGDVDAYFRKSGGVTKATRQFEGTCLEPNLIKVQKDVVFPKSAGLQGCESGSPGLIPDDYSTVEKASVCGSKKVRPTVPSTTLTKGQDKLPLKRKIFKKANIPCNAPVPSTASERSCSDVSEQHSAAGCHPPSENEDPNPTSLLRKRASRVGSKSKTPPSVSSSVYAASQSVFERKETSESMVLHAQLRGTILRDAVEIDDSAVEEQVLMNVTRDEASGDKGRKRKPSGRNVDGLVSRALESHPSFKSRVSKVSRKVSVLVDTESCSESKEVATVCSRTVSQTKTVVTSSVSATSTLAPALTKKTSTSRKSRRNSDQSRRRKSSGANSRTRSRRQNLFKGPSPEGEEDTRTKASGVDVSTVSSQASCQQEVNSSDPRLRDVGHEVDGKVHLSTVPLLSGEMVASNRTMQDEELASPILTEASPEGRRPVHQADFSLEDANQALSSEQRRNSVGQLQDETQVSEGELRSTDILLSEQLWNLHLKQGNETVQTCDGAHQSIGELDEQECQLAGNGASDLEICEKVGNERLQDSMSGHKALELKDEVKRFGVLVDKGTVLDVSETNYLVSNGDKVEPDNKSLVCNEFQAEERHIDTVKDFQARLSGDVSTSDGWKATSAVSNKDNADQVALLEQLQNLRLPQGDESNPSHVSEEERILDHEVKVESLSCSYSESSGTKNESLLSSARTSDIARETKINSTQKRISETAARLKKEKQYRAIVGEASSLRGANHTKPCLLKQNKKRKSTDMAGHKSDFGVLNPTVASNAYEQQTVKIAAQSSAASSFHTPGPSSVKIAAQSSAASSFHTAGPSTVRSATLSVAGQQKKMKTTCPQPFRLRTQERGALKEVEFNKKVEQYLAVKEKAPLSCEPNKETKKPPKAPSKESKWPVRPVHQNQTRTAAASATQQHDEEEIKKLRKRMVPHSQKMPCFDRPFKPHRSTKSPTIPNSPNFQHKMKKTAPATVKDD